MFLLKSIKSSTITFDEFHHQMDVTIYYYSSYLPLNEYLEIFDLLIVGSNLIDEPTSYTSGLSVLYLICIDGIFKIHASSITVPESEIQY